MFKKIRSVKLPYRKQGYIYFTCADYENQPREVRDKIDKMCAEIGGSESRALFEILTCGQSVAQTAKRYFVNEKKLYKMRKTFFETW